MTLRILGIDPGLNITGYGVRLGNRQCRAKTVRGGRRPGRGKNTRVACMQRGSWKSIKAWPT